MEIEIKLLIAPQVDVLSLTDCNSLPELHHLRCQTLGNCYFDTPDLALRAQDMGLRVRRIDDHREQTLKTSGKVAGGLHARPEYNVTIDQDSPNLFLFDASLWSESERERLQNGLLPQFNTDFVRQSAEVTLKDGTTLEVALDKGWIKAGDRVSAVHEIELELINGEVTSLLTLARQLMQESPLRLGLDSKAARGYRLAGLSPQPQVCADIPTEIAARLNAWQRNEERLMSGDKRAQAPLAAVLSVLAKDMAEEGGFIESLAQKLESAACGKTALNDALLNNEYGLSQLYWLERSLSD